MSGEQEGEEAGGDLGGVGEEGGKLHLFQQMWGHVSAKHPQQEQPMPGQGLQCALPVPCLGQNCFCRGRRVKGVRDLVVSLFLLGKLRDNPFISSGLFGWKLSTYKWEALDHLHHQVPTQCQCSHPNCMRFEITFADDLVRTAVP